jgi:DNA-binding PadR family transcriptional regulator
MPAADVTLLGYALLGLLAQKPSSGYDLRKVFAHTPMQSFSDSPGAIYPALKRLEKRGLIRGKIEHGSGLRRRQVFRLTAAGGAALKSWLRKPPTQAEVIRAPNELMLRFSFMDVILGPEDSQRFLAAVQRELTSYIPTLREYLAAHKADLPLSAKLALENGIRADESLLRWARDAQAAYVSQAKALTPPDTRGEPRHRR